MPSWKAMLFETMMEEYNFSVISFDMGRQLHSEQQYSGFIQTLSRGSW